MVATTECEIPKAPNVKGATSEEAETIRKVEFALQKHDPRSARQKKKWQDSFEISSENSTAQTGTERGFQWVPGFWAFMLLSSAVLNLYVSTLVHTSNQISTMK